MAAERRSQDRGYSSTDVCGGLTTVVLQDVDQDLSDCSVLNGLVGIGGLCQREPVQRQASVFGDRQCVVDERKRDVIHGRPQGRVADGIEQNELVTQVFHHVLPDIERELRAAFVGVD